MTEVAVERRPSTKISAYRETDEFLGKPPLVVIDTGADTPQNPTTVEDIVKAYAQAVRGGCESK